MDTKEVSGAAEDSPFGPWLLVSYGSKYGKGNGGTRNIGKAGNWGRMSGGGVQAVKTGVENISIDGVFEVLNEEMDDVVNDDSVSARGGSLSTSGGKSKQQVTQNINIVYDEDDCYKALDNPRVLQQLHKDVIASMAFDNQVEVDSNNKASKIDIIYDATFEVAASNLKEVMARVIE
ncbi:hypothetical protein Q3G72_008919 [Acer saccharum]|nr:hypothetical protein Q3G72_008919 [Acer saccharum]